jgi:hypothetical protein
MNIFLYKKLKLIKKIETSWSRIAFKGRSARIFWFRMAKNNEEQNFNPFGFLIDYKASNLDLLNSFFNFKEL